ncbi:MAG: MATE family efflux transporter [Treponema sp.]|nr:MATE family efflux transporter [Treponema sp.]
MKQTLMTEGAPFGLLIRFSIPIMLTDIIQQIYTIADSVIVGRLIGVNAFAAVSAAGSFYWLILVILFGFSHGFGVLIAQAFGSKNHTELRRICALALWLTVVGGVILAIICLIFVKPVLTLMQTPIDILDDAVIYLSTLLCGLLWTFLNSVLFSIFRSLGDSKTPLYTFVVCSILNIILDILLVIYTPMGVAAAALATVFTQMLSVVFCLWYLIKYTEIRFDRQDFRMRASIVKELLRLGAPLGLRDCISAVGGIVIQYFINGYGTLFIAGVAAAKKLYSILFIIGGGVDGAIAVFTAQNYGAGRFDRIKKGVLTARRIMIAGLLVIIPLMLMFGRKILGLFILDADERLNAVLDIAVNQLQVCLILLPALYMLFLYRSALQGMGNSFTPMLSGIMEAGLRILGVLILPLFFGEWGVYIAEPLGWPAMAIQLYISYILVYKQKNKDSSRFTYN